MNISINTTESNVIEVQVPQRTAVSVVDRGSFQAFQVDKHFTHNQTTAAASWTIQHNLGKFPSVMIVDSANNVVAGEILYIDLNSVQVTFKSAFKGKAFFN